MYICIICLIISIISIIYYVFAAGSGEWFIKSNARSILKRATMPSFDAMEKSAAKCAAYVKNDDGIFVEADFKSADRKLEFEECKAGAKTHYYLYHVTNAADVMTGAAAAPVVEKRGPWVFTTETRSYTMTHHKSRDTVERTGRSFKLIDDAATKKLCPKCATDRLCASWPYDKDIVLNSDIVLKLPGWKKQSGPITAGRKSGCGATTTFAVTYTDDDTPIKLTVQTEQINQGSTCEIRIVGYANPSYTIEANNEIIQQRIDDDSGSAISSTPFKSVSTVDAIIENGILSNDALRFSNKIPSATGVSMTYEFSYNRQLVSGDMIELKLPNWSNGGNISTASSCGTATFIITEIGSRTFCRTFHVRLAVLL